MCENMIGRSIIIGIVSFIAAVFANLFIGGFVGMVIPGGDDFLNSYFHPLYAGICVMIAVIISCTYIIVSKINQLMKK